MLPHGVPRRGATALFAMTKDARRRATSAAGSLLKRLIAVGMARLGARRSGTGGEAGLRAPSIMAGALKETNDLARA